MLYLNRTFSCPAAGPRTPDIKWDLAFLSAEDFNDKYGIPAEEVTDDFIRKHSQ